jgi:tetratricopeptide (TPR) repeat protein
MLSRGCSIAAVLLLLSPGVAMAQQAPTVEDGFALLRAGKPDDARNVFEAVLGGKPDDSQAQSGEVQASEGVALAQYHDGHRVEALQALLRARPFAPRSPRLLVDLGILEEEMKLYPNAEKDLGLAQQVSPNDLNADYAMARVKMDEGQLDAAGENMKAYLKARPDDASAHYGMGRIDELGMQFDQARAEFLRSIAIQPVQTEAYYELGDVDLKQDNYTEALSYFQKVLARNGQHAGALADAGQALYREKQYTAALPYLQRAVVVAPAYQPGHYYLGLTLSRLGRKEESNRELLTAQKLADEDNRNAGRTYQISPAPASQ